MSTNEKASPIPSAPHPAPLTTSPPLPSYGEVITGQGHTQVQGYMAPTIQGGYPGPHQAPQSTMGYPAAYPGQHQAYPQGHPGQGHPQGQGYDQGQILGVANAGYPHQANQYGGGYSQVPPGNRVVITSPQIGCGGESGVVVAQSPPGVKPSVTILKDGWSKGLCGCCDNCGTCLLSWFCPCYVMGKNAEKLGHSCCGYGFGSLIPIVQLILHTMVRAEIRQRRGIAGTEIGDCCTVCWCKVLALTQESHELSMMGEALLGETIQRQ